MELPLNDAVVETPVRRRSNQGADDLYQDTQIYITQPTQIIDHSVLDTPERSTVQVLASSPIAPKSYAQSGFQHTARDGYPTQNQQAGFPVQRSSFAPPGTQLRRPQDSASFPQSAQQTSHRSYGQQSLTDVTNSPRQSSSFDSPSRPRKLPVYIDLSDDGGMKYQGTNSDDELSQSRDIKPSIVKRRNAPAPTPSERQKATTSRFEDILAKARYDGSTHIGQNNNLQKDGRGTIKPPSDLMAAAYGGVTRMPKNQRQEKASPHIQKKQPITSLDQIADSGVREKAKRILDILPDKTIANVLLALRVKKGHVDDATQHLVDSEPSPDEAQFSDHELSQTRVEKKPRAKQELKSKVKSVYDKYGISKDQASQHRQISVQSSSRKRTADSEITHEQSRRKKLVRGDRISHKKAVVVTSGSEGSDSVQISREKKVILIESDSEDSKLVQVYRKEKASHVYSDSEDSDSGVAGIETKDDYGQDGDLLRYFNERSIEQLMDLANASRETVEKIIAHRPFRNFGALKKVKAPGSQSKRRGNQQTLGERVFEYSERMWDAFKSIDVLVDQCRDMRQNVTSGISAWKVDVVGLAKDGEFNLVNFRDSGSPNLKDSGIGTPATMDEHATLTPQPITMAKDIKMKDYQVIGMNWMALLFDFRYSGILADEMGLGKTCQVISLLAHLKETGVRGPHVVIVPTSVFDNWLREFDKFCPSLTLQGIEGSQKERQILQQKILDEDPYVVLTTYSFAKQKDDRRFLSSLRPVSCIFDEGHSLTHSASAQYQELMKITTEWRLVLTGTPLQNNLAELVDLLAFLMPDVFREHEDQFQLIFDHRAKTTDTDHSALLSAERTARARSMIAPFILRRKKEQVEELPKKTCLVEYCELSDRQKDIYDDLLSEYSAAKKADEAGKNKRTTKKLRTAALMNLRKAAIHPLLLRRIFDDKRIDAYLEMLYKVAPPANNYPKQHYREDLQINYDFAIHSSILHDTSRALQKFALKEEDWMNASKVQKLVSLLRAYKANGDRALVFSQFRMALDVLEAVFETEGIRFCRIDGNTPRTQRQPLIDMFTEDEGITAFLMTSKAGGMGLNIAAANKVIIFDMSFNPFVDVQAENRAHRIGQTRPVEVVRLVAKGTVEEHIANLGAAKLQLDERVAGDDAGAEKVEKLVTKAVEEMMEQTGV